MNRQRGTRAIFFQVLLVVAVLSLIAVLVALGPGTAVLLLSLAVFPLLLPCQPVGRARLAPACSARMWPLCSRAPPAA